MGGERGVKRWAEREEELHRLIQFEFLWWHAESSWQPGKKDVASQVMTDLDHASVLAVSSDDVISHLKFASLYCLIRLLFLFLLLAQLGAFSTLQHWELTCSAGF